MTDTEIIIEVAKLDGYDNAQYSMGEWIGWKGRLSKTIFSSQETYLTSRDAIVPVIEKWFKENWAVGNRFVDALFELHSCLEGSADLTDVYNTSAQITTALILSTPKKLCIAFLKATGKWKE